MATEIDPLILVFVVTGLGLLLFFLYISSIEKVFERVGFTRQEAATILTLTLFLGWITIPIFPYGGWWVGVSIGGAIIPLLVCYVLVRSRRVNIAEGAIGVVIVSVVTYFITRAEEGVGIVADLPLAFAPALAAGFFAFTTFWIDIKKAAPLAYFSGVVGTLVGADVFHLGEILAFSPPEDQTVILSIGGANIFDMVYLTGIVAVFVDVVVFWIKMQEKKHGFERIVSDWERGAEGLPYATEPKPEPTMRPGRRGKLE